MRNFFLFIGLVLFTFSAFSQHEEFQDETFWYSSKVILNGNTFEYGAPIPHHSYYKGPVIESYYYEFGDEMISTIAYCDDECFSEVYFLEEGELQIDGFLCLASETSNNLDDYCDQFRLFWEQVGEFTTATYEIVEEEDYKELIITDVDGNQTFYRNVVPLSVDKNEFSDLRIYPNPIEEVIYFDNLPNPAVVRIFDLTGAELLQKNILEGQAQLELGFLSKGVYFYKLQSGTSIKTGKLIKL